MLHRSTLLAPSLICKLKYLWWILPFDTSHAHQTFYTAEILRQVTNVMNKVGWLVLSALHSQISNWELFKITYMIGYGENDVTGVWKSINPMCL